MEGRGGLGGLHRQMTWELELEGRVGFYQAVTWEEGHSWYRNISVKGMAGTMVQGSGKNRLGSNLEGSCVLY